MEMDIEKLKEIINKSRVGMLGSYTNSNIHFRPMSHVDIDDEGKIWFFTSQASIKADELEKNSSVLIMYFLESENTYIILKGMAYLNTSREKRKALFNSNVRAWFPDGLNDPNICLLVVEPNEVEYWSANENRIITSIKILWSAITKGSPPTSEHKKVRL